MFTVYVQNDNTPKKPAKFRNEKRACLYAFDELIGYSISKGYKPNVGNIFASIGIIYTINEIPLLNSFFCHNEFFISGHYCEEKDLVKPFVYVDICCSCKSTYFTLSCDRCKRVYCPFCYTEADDESNRDELEEIYREGLFRIKGCDNCTYVYKYDYENPDPTE